MLSNQMSAFFTEKNQLQSEKKVWHIEGPKNNKFLVKMSTLASKTFSTKKN